MPKPDISVVTCTYNSDKFLEKCLKSVESQTFKNIEHIFNDSFSSDKTLGIINDYIKRNKNKYPIKFFQTKPQGIAKALNDSYPKAEGEIIHFLHSDDYYIKKNVLMKIYKIFKKYNCQWMTANASFEYKGKIYKFRMPDFVRDNFKFFINSSNFLSHENTFVRTKLLEKFGGFDESNNISVEYRLWLRMSEKYDPQIINDYFTVFIIHPGSNSTGSVFNFAKGLVENTKTLNKEKIIPIVGIKRNKIFQKWF